MKVTYRLVQKADEPLLRWEVQRVEGEDEDIIYAEARFDRESDAVAFLHQLEQWASKT